MLVKADFNQDGLPDVVGTGGPSNCLIVYYGDRSMGLRPGPIVKLPTNPFGIEVANLNGDSLPDLIFHGATRAVSDDLTITFPLCASINQGSSFSTPVCVQILTALDTWKFDDLDGDGIPEFLYTRSRQRPSILTRHTFDRNALGFRAAPESIVFPIPRGTAVVLEAADLNGDRQPDIAVSLRPVAGDDPPASIAIGLNQGQGRFALTQTISTPRNCIHSALIAVDLNRDSALDLIALCGQQMLLYFGTGVAGGHRFRDPQAVPLGLASTFGITIEDFDRDGIPDFSSAGLGGGRLVMRGRGDGSFEEPVRLETTLASFAVAGDFNGDGLVDFVTGSSGSAERNGTYEFFRGRRAATGVSVIFQTNNVPYGRQVEILASLQQSQASFTSIADGALVLEDARGRAVATGKLVLSAQQQSPFFPRTVGTVKFSAALDAGTERLFVRFAGNPSFASSISDAVAAVVLPAATVSTFTAPALIREPSFAAFTVNVASNAPATPQGTVALQTASGRILATAALSAGRATLTVSSGDLALGANLLRVAYGGERNFSASQSEAVVVNLTGAAQVVNAAHSAGQPGVAARDSLATIYLSRPIAGTAGAANWRVSFHPASGAVTFAGLTFAGGNQINFHVPPALANGRYRVIVENSAATLRYETDATVTPVSPGIFSLPTKSAVGPPAAQVVIANSDGGQRIENVFDCAPEGECVVKPIALSTEAVLVLYGTGLRAAQRVSASLVADASGSEVSLAVLYAGAHASITGLDQVNVQLPASLREFGNGLLKLTADTLTSNVVALEIR